MTQKEFVEKIAKTKASFELTLDQRLSETDLDCEMNEWILIAREISGVDPQFQRYCQDCGTALCGKCGQCHSGCFLSAETCALDNNVDATVK